MPLPWAGRGYVTHVGTLISDLREVTRGPFSVLGQGVRVSGSQFLLRTCRLTAWSQTVYPGRSLLWSREAAELLT